MAAPAPEGEAPQSTFNVNAAPIMLGFHEVNIIDRASQTPLLHDVSGFVVKGGTLGVVGPSSSGKTLLMRALAGRAEDIHMTGDVVLDGRFHDPVHSRVAMEEDLLVGVLTLRESLEISMMLRRDLPKAECKKIVDSTIRELDLARVSDSVIGTVLRRGLSGGQKRRTSVGVELVANSGKGWVSAVF